MYGRAVSHQVNNVIVSFVLDTKSLVAPEKEDKRRHNGITENLEPQITAINDFVAIISKFPGLLPKEPSQYFCARCAERHNHAPPSTETFAYSNFPDLLILTFMDTLISKHHFSTKPHRFRAIQ